MATQTRWLRVTSTVTNQTLKVQSFFSFFFIILISLLCGFFRTVLGFYSSSKCCFGSFRNAISSLCLGM